MNKLTFCITTLSKGGAERVICNLANYFSSLNNFDVSIIAINKSSVDYELNDNIKVFFANSFEKKGKITNIVVRNTNFKKIIKNISPDLVVSFLPVSVFISLFHKNHYKTIISVRNDPKIEYGSFKNKILSKLLFPKANAIVFQTNDAMNYFSSYRITKKVIILNPISEKFLINDNNCVRKKRIVTVGRLEPQKNHILLINSFNEFQKKHNDYCLDIYGEGSMRHELEELINNLELSNKVFLRGRIDDVPSAISNASLFVLSSDYEGLPNSLMEAMVLGLPVISTDCPCGGPRMLIENGVNGILVKVGDAQEMCEAMDFVLKSNKRIDNFSIQAKKIIEKVSPDCIYNEWYDLICDVLSSNK